MPTVTTATADQCIGVSRSCRTVEATAVTGSDMAIAAWAR